jgi:hypothetical protein
MRVSKFRVDGRFTPAASATISVSSDGKRGTFSVRPLHSRREITIDLATLAGLVILRDAKAGVDYQK